MNGWIISTIALTVIVIVELVCFLTHKVKQHNRKKYKTYLSKKERQIINKWLQKYPEDYGMDYFDRKGYEEEIRYLKEQMDWLKHELYAMEYTVDDICDLIGYEPD